MNRSTAIRLASIPAVLAATAGSALAAVDATVMSEITGAKADVLAVGAAVFAVAVGIVLYKWFKRAL